MRCARAGSGARWLAWIVGGLGIATSQARDEPLWEFGMGAGAIAFEDYRGSGTSHAYPVPVPYFVYNGRFLQADREGIRGKLFNQDWIEINLAFDATTPVRSDRARNGMPDLKTTVEGGPAVNLHLFKSDDGRVKFDLRLPLLAAVTVQAPPKYVGFTFSPRLALDLADPAGFTGWHAGLLTGPLFADRRYHDYFYTVQPQYATPDRPEYHASGGYAGTQFIGALSKRYRKFWVGAYARYDTLSGAVFEDSPLVVKKSYWSAGFGFAWMIARSDQRVEVPD